MIPTFYTTGLPQTCTNTWKTGMHPGVLSFKVELVDKCKLMEVIILLFWEYQIQPLPLGEGLDLISSK